MIGRASIHRKIIERERYTHIPTKVLFMHLLIVANHEDNRRRGNVISRGQRLTSISHLSTETGLSIQQVRTALKNLEKTGEITCKSTNKNTIITMIKYDFYQGDDGRSTCKSTNKQQTNNNQSTTNNNDNNEKNDNNIINTTKVVQQVEEEYGNTDLNRIIDYVKNSCERHGLIYSGTGRDERRAAKRLNSKKHQKILDGFGMTLEQFLDNVILVSTKLKYNTQQVTSVKKIYYNRADIVNKAKKEKETTPSNNVLEL